MNNRLTYKIKEILMKNDYSDVVVKHKTDDKEVKINDANVKFRYEPKTDKGFLCFGKSNEENVCQVEDGSINEVVINDDSLVIETSEKRYYCYIRKEKIYF